MKLFPNFLDLSIMNTKSLQLLHVSVFIDPCQASAISLIQSYENNRVVIFAIRTIPSKYEIWILKPTIRLRRS